MASSPWTARSDVVEVLRKRWRRGEFPAALAAGRAVAPLSVPLRGPSAREVADRFGEVQDWVRRWEADTSGLRLEYVPVGGRLVGSNRLPGRAWVDDDARLWRLIGVTAEVAAFRQVLALTLETCPDLEPWVRDHPLKALAGEADWSRLLSVVRWMVDHGGPGVYLRQIDVPGVDTKFVETHRGVLGELLDTVLPPERIDPAVPHRRLAERYRLAAKPGYVRCRSLDGRPLLPASPAGVPPALSPAAASLLAAVSSPAAESSPAAASRERSGPTELTFRVRDAAEFPPPGRRVVIVENEITYLALPPVPDTLAVLGGGYGITALDALSWLREREVYYWGDLDTHGFAILDRLRTVVPAVRSLLMDRATLEEHREHWGREPTPVHTSLEQLTEPERDVYTDLVEDRYAPALRLEQERIRFGAVRCALGGLG